MKKFLLLTATCLASFFYEANAQNFNGRDNAIGVRITNGVELSFQRQISPENRIETTFGYYNHYIGMTGSYLWALNLNSANKGSWNLYYGAGAYLGGLTKNNDTGFSLGFLGHVGTEYVFKNTPIVLFIDYKPTLFLSPSTIFAAGDTFGIGARYYF